tara:strand:+ start:864 stop:1250 length:387 start_codon:yes stop_codon:yes gene_type:complete
MAHFAKLDSDNNVLWVTPLQDNICNDDEATGVAYLTKHHNWPLWKKTSFNTYAGVHLLGGTPYRANFAGTGYVYDQDLDIFKEKNKPFSSWVMNNTKGKYEAPVVYPTEYYSPGYKWNENNQTWDKIS